jgi:hypothetical protein
VRWLTVKTARSVSRTNPTQNPTLVKGNVLVYGSFALVEVVKDPLWVPARTGRSARLDPAIVQALGPASADIEMIWAQGTDLVNWVFELQVLPTKDQARPIDVVSAWGNRGVLYVFVLPPYPTVAALAQPIKAIE